MSRSLAFLFDAIATAGVSMARAAGALAAFLFAALVSNRLGADQAGAFFTSLTWAFGLAIVARWGACDLILLTHRSLVRSWRRPAAAGFMGRFLRISLFRMLLVLPIFAVLNEVAIWSGIGPLAPRPEMVLALAPLFVIQQLLSASAKASGNPAAASAVEFCMGPGLAIVVALLFADVVTNAGLVAFELLYGAGIALSIPVLLGLGGQQIAWLRPVSSKASKALLRRSNNFATIELFGFCTSWTPLLLTPLLMTTHDAGILNGVLRIANIVLLITVSIPAVFTPRLANARFRNDDIASAALIRSMTWVMRVGGAGFLIALAIFGKFALGLFGAEFEAGYVPLLVCGAGLCGALALGPAGEMLKVLGQEKIFRNVILASGIGSLIATAPAIYFFGITGAAAVTGLAALLQKLALVRCLRQLQRRQSA